MPNGSNGRGANGSLPAVPLDGPRLYLNGFPKSGLHLLWTWALPFVARPAYPRAWAGSFQGNAWTTTWVETDTLLGKLDALVPGTYLKAHTGYREDIDAALRARGIVHVFIYRDPRDVAVSQAYHILRATPEGEKSEDGKLLYHPGAAAIREMADGEFDYILAACIAGYGPWNGLIERWEQYAGWLDTDWTLCLRFEDMRERPDEMAQLMIRYVYGRAAKVQGMHLGLYQEDLDKATAHLLKVADAARDKSPTFRKGQTGGWREAFTDEHIALWREHDPTDWVTRLGYEWG